MIQECFNVQAVVLEGKYWKRQCDVIKAEYMKWRKFYRAKGFGGTPSILDTVSERNVMSWLMHFV